MSRKSACEVSTLTVLETAEEKTGQGKELVGEMSTPLEAEMEKVWMETGILSLEEAAVKSVLEANNCSAYTHTSKVSVENALSERNISRACTSTLQADGQKTMQEENVYKSQSPTAQDAEKRIAKRDGCGDHTLISLEAASVSDGDSKVRTLTPEEVERLKKDTALVSDYKQQKLEKEAEKNWDLFYKRNTTKFFKDRHWTKREFQELVGSDKDEGKRKVVFEVGCGVGNFMFPLLEEDVSKSLFVYACDFSKRAIQFVKDHSSYDASRCSAFHADITLGLDDNIPDNSVNLATMIFVLSAIHPDKMVQALHNVFQTLMPGGLLLFRDYGLYDYAMLRFAPGHKLSEHFYVRQDGTRAFYFSAEFLKDIAEQAGFEACDIQYVHRDTVNKKEGICVPRIFVQAKFIKATSSKRRQQELLQS